MILSCCKDIDAIAFYLLTEEWAQMLVVSYQVNTATKKLLEILGGFDVNKEFRRHRDKEVNVATLVLFASGHRSEKAHRGNAKALLQLWLMLTDNVDICL